MCGQLATDAEIAALAEAQHGVVDREQLVVLGFTRRQVEHRLACGRLHLVHRGVYAVGHRVLNAEGHWMAATLATGGALSHGTAAAAWEWLPVGAAIHVTVAGDPGRARRRGVRIHRSQTLGSHDITRHRGVRVTAPIRALLDVARTLEGRRLERVLDRAEPLIDFAELRHRLPGSPSLRAVLSSYTAGSTPTRSELDRRSSGSVTITVCRGRTSTPSSRG